MELNIIYNEDCLTGMQRLPDKSIDAIICDLPYGTTDNKWDSVIPLDLLWAQYKRLIKRGGAIVLFAQSPFDKILGASNLEMLKYEWIWEKEIATGFFNANHAPLKKHENILVFSNEAAAPVSSDKTKEMKYRPQMTAGKPYISIKGDSAIRATYNGKKRTDTISNGKRYPMDILHFGLGNERGLHPTQKPVKLLEYLVRTYSDEGDLILDNCMGSGTTAVACKRTGRNFIGFELNEDYYKIAIDRINDVQRINEPTKGEPRQLDLFGDM